MLPQIVAQTIDKSFHELLIKSVESTFAANSKQKRKYLRAMQEMLNETLTINCRMSIRSKLSDG